ncbi:protoporphyrinogen oxidase [Kushneria marisflavi]|uniref:Protoporphyrinogen oxidase n=1 Tax=Kushneria marisflavi TaxID=157779 RepID=A0A240UML0_9GAMM|nr:protoporphyrinogen oxidase [Kushneria marisflavi]ART62259.1 protoporphyrinogen oxidase [Kushneria marisflavi]RKD87354.1 oxygen-dependent protoporphyrinogen oxidase [Kushneria marisflavi]
MVEGSPNGDMLDVIVVGGGATGLACARVLARGGKRVVLLEQASRVGGNISSRRDGDWQTEIGPNTLIMKPPLYRLLEEMNLLDEVQSANPTAQKRFVAMDGTPVALPTHLLRALNNPLIGREGWSQIVREPFVKKSQAEEESLAGFVERRLGRRVLERMVDPFVSGVYAGDPQRLSAQAAMPRLVAIEQEYGSLIRGGLTRLWQSRRATPEMPAEWRGKLMSFPSGLERLAERLAEEIESCGGEIACQCEISTLKKLDNGWEVTDAKGHIRRARELVLAVSAPVAAGLLGSLDEALTAPLEEIAYPPVNAVALGFRREDVTHALDGFGVLIPSVEKRRTLGALFSSTIFEGRAPAGHCLINAFIGGRRQPEAAEGSDAEQIRQVLYDLRDLLGIRGDPVWQQVNRWPRAIPQYELGHLKRIARLDRALEHHSGLSLVGNWRDGIAVGDCLENGRLLGERLAGRL